MRALAAMTAHPLARPRVASIACCVPAAGGSETGFGHGWGDLDTVGCHAKRHRGRHRNGEKNESAAGKKTVDETRTRPA